MTMQPVALNDGWTGYHRAGGDGGTPASVTGELIDILDAVDVPIVVVRRNFTIACFNRAAAEVLGLGLADVGRSPSETSLLTGLLDLEEWCAQAIAGGTASRHDFRDQQKSFVVRISPYTRSDCQITGAVLTFTNVTAFRASIDQAIQERECTKAILNTVAEPLVVLSAELRVETANRAFYALFRTSRDETQGVPLFELRNRAFDLRRLRTQLQEMLANDCGFQPLEIDHDFPAIGCRTVIISARPLSLPGHSGRRILLGFQDITERKRTEHELSDLFENGSVGLHWIDAHGIILRANRHELEMLGYSRDEYVGRHISEFHVNEQVIGDILKRLSAGEALSNCESQLRCKDGSIRDVVINSSVLWDNGRFVHTRCFTHDITDRRKVEEVSQRLSAIVDSSGDAIVSKDLTGTITSWNRGAERLFGYTAEEAIGKSITILIPMDRRDEEPGILGRVRRGESIANYETTRLRKDGTPIEISLTVSPVKDASGKVIGASKIARDISERKRTQARQELLAQEINHRTKDLFAVLHSVVSRSFVGKQTVQEAKSAVLSRLHALADTHAMLVDHDWEGADLAEVVRREMSPHAGRVTIEGPSVILAAKAAQTFALALHELATNAAKYGALSNSTGQVHIGWSVGKSNGQDLLTFRWHEQGGPRVTAPTRKGFGSAVLETVMGEYFDTPAQIQFEATGVSYELNGALEHLTTGAGSRS